MFMLEILDDALTLFEKEGQGDPEVFAEQLRQAEIQNYTDFHSSIDYYRPHAYEDTGIPLETLYKSPNYCHTARLAAEARYLGILTERQDLVAQNTYDKGVEMNLARQKTDTSIMPLSYDQTTRQLCEIPVQNDYKDFFMVAGTFTNYASLTVPNDSEVKAYGEHDLKGIIAICGAACGWSCPKDVVFGLDKVTYRVNGEAVANFTTFDGCHFLQRADKSYIWPKNAQGRFELHAKVLNQKEYMRLSTMIVW